MSIKNMQHTPSACIPHTHTSHPQLQPHTPHPHPHPHSRHHTPNTPIAIDSKLTKILSLDGSLPNETPPKQQNNNNRILANNPKPARLLSGHIPNRARRLRKRSLLQASGQRHQTVAQHSLGRRRPVHAKRPPPRLPSG